MILGRQREVSEKIEQKRGRSSLRKEICPGWREAPRLSDSSIDILESINEICEVVEVKEDEPDFSLESGIHSSLSTLLDHG